MLIFPVIQAIDQSAQRELSVGVSLCVWLSDCSCHQHHLFLSPHMACWSPFMLTSSVRSLQFGSTAHS